MGKVVVEPHRHEGVFIARGKEDALVTKNMAVGESVYGEKRTTVSHVSDVVGPEGMVYAVEFSHRSGRDLLNVAKKRTNVVPIIEDARHPHKYRMLVPMVDCVFSDVAQPDQA